MVRRKHVGTGSAVRNKRRQLGGPGVTSDNGGSRGVASGEGLEEPPLGQGMWIHSDTQYFGLDTPLFNEYLGTKITARDNLFVYVGK